MSTAYCVMEYLYRDAGNYKAWGYLLLKGISCAADEKTIRSCLDSGEYFLPEKIGIPALQPQIWAAGFPRNSDDHDFHEFVELREATPTEINTMTAWGTLDDLLAHFRQSRMC